MICFALDVTLHFQLEFGRYQNQSVDHQKVAKKVMIHLWIALLPRNLGYIFMLACGGVSCISRKETSIVIYIMETLNIL